MKRPKRRPFGSVYLRGRTWWAKFSMADGTRVRRNLHVTVDAVDEEGARELMEKARAEAVLNGKPVPGRLDFAGLSSLLRTSYTNKARRSWDRVECALKPLAKAFGKSQAREIEGDALDRYLAARLAVVSRGPRGWSWPTSRACFGSL